MQHEGEPMQSRHAEPVYTAQVPFNVANVSRCLCPGCPVQSDSSCVAEKNDHFEMALKQNPLNPEELPAAYCSSGVARCKDLDGDRTCICGSCPVFSEYYLASGEPAGYFCQYGATR